MGKNVGELPGKGRTPPDGEGITLKSKRSQRYKLELPRTRRGHTGCPLQDTTATLQLAVLVKSWIVCSEPVRD